MPVTAQAEKKLRRDRKQQKINAVHRTHLRDGVKKMRKTPTKKQLQAVFTLLDKSVKLHVIHKNKAARLKSRLSKLLVTNK
jgi:small subunit ribosomal protein S20